MTPIWARVYRLLVMNASLGDWRDIVPKNVSYPRKPNIINVLKSTLRLLTRSHNLPLKAKTCPLSTRDGVTKSKGKLQVLHNFELFL